MEGVKARALFLAAVVVLVGTGTAAAKFTNSKITVDDADGVTVATTQGRRVMDRISLGILNVSRRNRVERPETLGPAYALTYHFDVADDRGPRTETAEQILYPFASSGPIVRTEPDEGFDMTYGPVRFASGWYEVPPFVIAELQNLGLPATEPLPEREPSRVSIPSDGSPPWRLLVPLAGLIVWAGLMNARRHA